jgi:hypothetical protein
LKIEAIGSTALVEREIQAMEAMQFFQMALNPASGLDPEKAALELLKAKRMIPEKWTMDEDKKEAMKNQQPMIPVIEVAKIRAAQEDKKLEAEKWEHKVTTTANLRKMEVDTDRDQIYVSTMAERDRTTATIRIQELQIKRDLAMLDYATKKGIALDQIKSDLAKESMRLRTQKELAGVAREAHTNPSIPVTPQVATPAVEPPGHAADGRAFEQ